MNSSKNSVKYFYNENYGRKRKCKKTKESQQNMTAAKCILDVGRSRNLRTSQHERSEQ